MGPLHVKRVADEVKDRTVAHDVLLQNLHFIKDIGLKGYAVERHFWHFLKNCRFC